MDEGAKTIGLTVPYGTDVTALVPTITHTGACVSPNTGAAQNFTNPVTYTVTAGDSSTQAYIVTVTVAPNTAKAITAFDFNGLTPAVTGTVNDGVKTIALTVSYGTDVMMLVPSITHSGASVSPNTGVGQDFTNSVIYTVTAADSSTQQYTVTVIVAPNTAKAITAFDFNGLTPAVTGTVDEGAKTIALTVSYGTDVTALVPTITHTGASVSPNTGVAHNFTNPVTYTVIAADGSTQQYTVTVTVGASSNSNLSALSLSSGTLSPAFANSTTSYTLSVSHGVNSITLTPTVADHNATVTVSGNGAEMVFPPVQFEITAKTTKIDGTTKEQSINKFSNYVERVMEIPASVDPSKITTGIVFNADGTYSHVPTEVYQKNGKWYAKLNSLTNSDYSVIWNPVTVKSVENHWAKYAVNDMASRLVIFNPEEFEPNKAITRADFAEYIVRALGLYREGSTHENNFKDVSAKGERTLAILIANEYGIVSGYPDGTFRGDNQITREEAMVMYQRAMEITKLVGSDENRYQNYTDYSEVSDWATSYVKEVLSAHVFNGTTATKISPKASLNYAEAAQAIRNLLLESNLINK